MYSMTDICAVYAVHTMMVVLGSYDIKAVIKHISITWQYLHFRSNPLMDL